MKLNKYLFENINFYYLLITVILIGLFSFNFEINRDGVLYLNQAYLFSIGEYEKGINLFNWPFYSFLISIIYNILPVSFELAAKLISLSLFLLSVSYYLKILRFISKDKNIFLYGFLSLFLLIPLMDDYVTLILRDHGFWAFSLISLYYFFKWFDHGGKKNFFLINFGLIIAGLFRPEAFVFIFIFYFYNLIQIILRKKYLNFHFLISSLLLISFLLFTFNSNFFYNHGFSKMNIFDSMIQLTASNLFKPLNLISTNDHIQNLINDYPLIQRYSFLISISLIKWLKGFGVVSFLLFILGFLLIYKNKKRNILLFVLIINFIIPSVFLFNTYVISGRYFVLSWLTASIFSSFGIKYFLETTKPFLRINLRIFLILILFIHSLIIFIDTKHHDELIKVRSWIVENNVDSNTKVFFDDSRLAYLSGIFPYLDSYSDQIMVDNYDYLIIRDLANTKKLHIDNFSTVKTIDHENITKVLIFKKNEN